MTAGSRPAHAADRRVGWDAVSVLTGFIVLLFVIPSRLIFAPLGGAGSPAQLLGVAALLWWAASQLSRRVASPRIRQPVRIAMLVLVFSVLASYVAATVRPIDDVEMRAADRGLLSLLAWLGVVLVASDGIPSLVRLEVLLRRLSVAGGAVAVLGLAQFATGRPFTNYIQIPGLSTNSGITAVIDRGGFSRPAGTALHPIEYGIVLTMILPIAIHFALYDRHRTLLRRWWPVGALALAVPVSISRSAIVCTIVVLAVLLPAWPGELRRRAFAAVGVVLALVFVAVPGMIGTLFGLFSGIGTDSSAQSRTGSYALAATFIDRAPVFGRGFQTFLPEYRILDNQYLLTVIETGIVGVVALLGFFVTGIVTTRRARKLAESEATRGLAQALAASIAAGMASFALFDALSFPQVANLVMLAAGVTGGLYRLLQIGGPDAVSPASADPSTPARPAAGTAGTAS